MADASFAYYPELWKKAYLIELLDRETGVLKKSFAFSLPPESVRIEIPQRVNLTKTFGGAFVDDYGTDVAQITISGSTGNTAIKRVYADGALVEMDGKNEAYYLIEEILQYKSGLENYADYEMRIYDLSAVASTAITESSVQSMTVDGWTVVLKEGGITRSKEKPFFYNYSLQFIGIAALGEKRYKTYTRDKTSGVGSLFNATNVRYNFFRIGRQVSFDSESPSEGAGGLVASESGSEAVAAISENITIAEKEASFLEKMLTGYTNVVDSLNTFKNGLNEFRGKVSSYYRAVQGFLNNAVGTINTVFEIAAFPYDMIADIIHAATSVRNTIEGILPTIEAEYKNLETKYVSIAEMFRSLCHIEDATNNIAAISNSSGALPEGTMVPPETPGSVSPTNPDDPGDVPDAAMLMTYGDDDYIATSETTLEAVSLEVYGTPEYAPTIAAYNGISGDSDISAGDVLKIPKLSAPDTAELGDIYSLTDSQYGSDIMLDETGDMVLREHGDFGVISGIENMAQAINLRTTEREGVRMWIPAYGIRVAGGGFDAYSVAVLLTSMKETLLRDPRIMRVYNIRSGIDGDTLNLTFDVRLKAGFEGRFSVAL